MSAKKPKLPRFIPRIGIPFEPNSLANPNIEPSPPITIIKSD